MYEVTLIGIPGTFFTAQNPLPSTDGPPVVVDKAVFDDSYTPVTGWRRTREGDARTAIANGNTHELRCNPRGVATVEDLG
jgi:hypothetical protein